MSLSLKESQAIIGVAGVLYNFLPASGRQNWKTVTFTTVAERLGISSFCLPGNKLNTIKLLLEQTLDQKRFLFERLIVEIVREGILIPPEER